MTYQFLHITHVFSNSFPGRSNIWKHPICMIKFSTLKFNWKCCKRFNSSKIIQNLSQNNHKSYKLQQLHIKHSNGTNHSFSHLFLLFSRKDNCLTVPDSIKQHAQMALYLLIWAEEDKQNAMHQGGKGSNTNKRETIFKNQRWGRGKGEGHKAIRRNWSCSSASSWMNLVHKPKST